MRSVLMGLGLVVGALPVSAWAGHGGESSYRYEQRERVSITYAQGGHAHRGHDHEWCEDRKCRLKDRRHSRGTCGHEVVGRGGYAAYPYVAQPSAGYAYPSYPQGAGCEPRYPVRAPDCAPPKPICPPVYRIQPYPDVHSHRGHR